MTFFSSTIDIRQALLLFMLVFLASLFVFALKRPDIPGEEHENKVTKIFVRIGISIGAILYTTFLARRLGFLDNNDTILFFLFILFENAINLLIPSIYVNSVPNMKDYIKNTTIDTLNSLKSSTAFLFVDICNFFNQLYSAFKPSPRIYPTIE